MEVNESSPMAATGMHQTEIGMLPIDWSASALSSLLNSKQLGGNYKNGPIETEWPLIKMGNIGRGRIDCRKIEFISASVTPSEGDRLQTDDVLFNTRNTLDLVGKVSIWRDEIPAAYFNSNIMRMEFDPQRVGSNAYMNYVLNTHRSIAALRAIATGTTSVAAIYSRDFTNVYLPIPNSKAEQQEIAAALSDADALIDSLEQLLAKKRQIKQGAMQELLTGKRRLPGFREKWGESTFADVALIDPENLGSGTCADFAFNYIALEGVDQGRLVSFTETQFDSAPSRARRVLREGDVLVATVRPNLKSHLLFDTRPGHWIASTGFSVVRCKVGAACPGFLFFLLFSSIVERQIDALLTGSNYPAINGRDVANLAFSRPPFDEQVAIAQVLSDMDADIAATEARITKARDLKQAMAQALLTGRVRLVEGAAA